MQENLNIDLQTKLDRLIKLFFDNCSRYEPRVFLEIIKRDPNYFTMSIDISNFMIPCNDYDFIKIYIERYRLFLLVGFTHIDYNTNKLSLHIYSY